jgi:hypothetical protein
MGAVGKSVVEYEDEKRPADDHSRTGLNAALKEPVLTLRVPTGSIAIVILGTRSRLLSRLRGACAPNSFGLSWFVNFIILKCIYIL